MTKHAFELTMKCTNCGEVMNVRGDQEDLRYIAQCMGKETLVEPPVQMLNLTTKPYMHRCSHTTLGVAYVHTIEVISLS